MPGYLTQYALCEASWSFEYFSSIGQSSSWQRLQLGFYLRNKKPAEAGFC